MRFKPGKRELPLLLAVVFYGLGVAPLIRPTWAWPLGILQLLANPIVVALLIVQVGCWFRGGSVGSRRWLIGGLLLVGLVMFMGRIHSGRKPGQTEILLAADDIWLDFNSEPGFALSPDRAWLVYGRVKGPDSYRSSGPAEVVARNLVTGHERTMVPAREDENYWPGMAVLWNLDEVFWVADTLIVPTRNSLELLVPASGEVSEASLKSRLPQRPPAEWFQRTRAGFSVPGSISDLAWDGRSRGGYLYFAAEGTRGGRNRLDRKSRAGRVETIETLSSPWASWSITSVKVSPNGRRVALRAIRTPRFSLGYLFFVIPIIGYQGVDHLIVVDTATGQSVDYGEFGRLHSLQWLPDSSHLAYFNDEIRGPVRLEVLNLPATEVDPDEPRVPWEGTGKKPGGPHVVVFDSRVVSLSSPVVSPSSRRSGLPTGWVSLDFGRVGFGYPSDRFRMVGGDSVLVLTQEVDGQAKVAYEINLNTARPENLMSHFRRLGPVPGFGPSALGSWYIDQASPDPTRERTFISPRGDGGWIRLAWLPGLSPEDEKQVTYRILASFEVKGRRGY